MPKARIPEATVRRLPAYLQALVEAAEAGVETMSSQGLAAAAGVNSAQVRKDLSHLGSYGIRGVGYDVHELAAGIADVLGIARHQRVAIVGIGNLGRALARYDGFAARGFTVAALLDADPDKIGTRVGQHRIEDVADLGTVVPRERITIALVATPAVVAQEVTDALVDAGVGAILNLAPARIAAPEHVSVRRVDMSTELQVLSFYARMGGRAGAETA